MTFFSSKRAQAGIEISANQLKSAIVFKKGNSFSIKQLSSVKIPSEILRPSFKMENITQPDEFQGILQTFCKDLNTKKVCVALPDSSVKVLIRKYKELPKDPREINEMLLWNISTALHLSVEDLRISWENRGKAADEAYVFLIALGLEKIIGQYEEAFHKIGVTPVTLAPAGLNQFNFYANMLSEEGIVAYLGLFDDVVTIFVFSDGIPVFYKIIRKGLLNETGASAINDMDVLIHYYNSENPDLGIEKCYIASHIKSETQIKQVLQDINPLEFVIMEETGLINEDHPSVIVEPADQPLYFYTAALGAAQCQWG